MSALIIGGWKPTYAPIKPEGFKWEARTIDLGEMRTDGGVCVFRVCVRMCINYL